MSKHYLSTLFSPKSVAIFGASDKPDSVGQIVMQNMLASGFKGKIYPVNSKHKTVQGQTAYASINDIGEPVELVVIATPVPEPPAYALALVSLGIVAGYARRKRAKD